MSARRPASAQRLSRETTINVRDAVEAYRANERELRRLFQVRPHRNFAATERAIDNRLKDRYAIELALLLGGHRALVGLLVSERDLLDRLGKARRAKIERPELKARYLAARAQINLIKDGGVQS